jgi:hypothetical protein
MRKPTETEQRYMNENLLSKDKIKELQKMSGEEKSHYCIITSCQAAKLLNSSDPESRGKGFALIDGLKKVSDSMKPEERSQMFDILYARG